MRTNFNHVTWYNSIRFSILLGFVIVFAIIAYVIYYVVQVRGKEQMMAESERLAQQIGGNIVNDLYADITEISSLTRSQAATAASLPKSEAIFMRVFSSVLDDHNIPIAGGGIWIAPYQFSKTLSKRSFYWHHNLANMLEYVADYNQSTTSYLEEDWYVTALVSQPGQCVWSKPYVDVFTSEPKVTCTVRIERDKVFFGAATVDLSLRHLSNFIEKWQQRTGGYIFIVDQDNQFLGFPRDKKVQGSTEDGLGQVHESYITADKLAKIRPDFLPVAHALRRFNAEAKEVASNLFNDKLKAIQTTLDEASPNILEDEAERKAITILDPLNVRFRDSATTLFAEVSIPKDHILDEPARAYLFHIPHTYWKLGIVSPTRQSSAVATELSGDLLKYILAVLGLASVFGYLLLNRGIISPLERTTSTLQTISDLINQKRYLELTNHTIDVKRKNEVGLVRHSVNKLIDRVVHNEGEIAAANIMLEKKVDDRTKELKDTLAELKRSQIDLVNSEKMAVLGQMVAGVAHEVNTPLGYVKNNVLMIKDMVSQYDNLIHHGSKLGELSKVGLPNKNALSKTIDEIVEIANDLNDVNVIDDMSQLFEDTLFGVEQISELVVNLRNFARLDESKVKDIDIHECIESSLNIARSNLKPFEVKKFYQDVPKISCSPSQINQVFLNFFNNAAQAMNPENGILAISTSHDNVYVHINVMDNGLGMSKQTIKKIFQPFFTTKAAGEGTGLGLAICMQIIEEHQGKIQVSSKEGEGTRFTISLPIDRQQKNI